MVSGLVDEMPPTALKADDGSPNDYLEG